jgi:HD-GYP domain-containing protein (c-di-GMP phosphodiesterase class II)
VQRIAVALGEELGLERERLDVLRFAGLFHDIGKIGVPGAILTKPDRLTELEFEVVKRHPEDGTRIVVERTPELVGADPTAGELVPV